MITRSLVLAAILAMVPAQAQGPLNPAVKPPNSTPTASDPAQVVVLGPNSAGFITIGDPCTFATKKNKAIATAVGTTQLVAPVANQAVYICSFHLTNATAAVWSLIEGAGATCTTPAAIWGSTTAASGESFAANGNMTYGNGEGTIGQSTVAGNGVCLLQSGTASLAGNISYVQH